MKWITFQGKEVDSTQIDHQHLSNAIWFGRIFFGLDRQELIDELSRRFNGQILRYRPHVDFSEEISALSRKGMITDTGDGIRTIFYGGRAIGEIRTLLPLT